MDYIDEFIEHYSRECDYYGQVGRLAASKLESLLQEAGIRAIVTSRPKSPTRLRNKCRQRERERENGYGSLAEIYEDIVDLVGVRVALYFPAERDQVDAVITSAFQATRDRKEFPGEREQRPEKRFLGYSAFHYLVRLRENEFSEADRRYSTARIEIQVASVLMHAWSEVEHDLIYKPLSGELSEDEYAILDQLNGLVLAGEIALERIQKAAQRRVAEADDGFANHYDLANHLLSQTVNLVEQPVNEAGLGRVDLLYQLLRRLGLGTAARIAPYLDSLHGDLERRPLADQIVDTLLDEEPGRYADYLEVRTLDGAVGDRSDDTLQSIAIFLLRWNELERLLQEAVPNGGRRSIAALLRDVFELGVVDEELVPEINLLRRYRNELVHGIDPPSRDFLQEVIRRLAVVTDAIRERRR